MKLGLRLAVVTALIMGVALGIASFGVIGLRRAELESEMQDRAREMATVLAAMLEPLDERTVRVLAEQRAALAARLHPFALDNVFVPPARPTDPGWAQLVEAATIGDKPVGRVFTPDNAPPFFATAVPLHDSLLQKDSGAPRHIAAVLTARRDLSDITRAVGVTVRRSLPFIGLAVALFGGVVYLLLRNSVVRPLRRLNDAIDAVAAGDLSRAVLPQRDDEIGVLAARFNVMTDSLRDARAKEARATATRSTLESRLHHTEKLATVGQMAAQIAHELGTPLNVIGGRARALEKRAADPAEVRKNAEIITAQVERIARIMRQILAFSRKKGPTLTKIDLGAVVSESLGFAAETRAGKGGAAIKTSILVAPDLPPIPGDAGEIQQVCLNLINNALQAMPDGGSLDVRLLLVTRRKEGLALSEPAAFVMLELGDSGPGIPEADRERVFEPFFTTKDSGEGTGLGLAVSKGIVDDHAGWLEVGDRPGGGALFRMYLPVKADAEAAEPDLRANLTRSAS